MTPKTCEGWLIWLDQQRPTEDNWNDPQYLELLSWAMLMFMWRRMNQRQIDAGFAKEARLKYH